MSRRLLWWRYRDPRRLQRRLHAVDHNDMARQIASLEIEARTRGEESERLRLDVVELQFAVNLLKAQHRAVMQHVTILYQQDRKLKKKVAR